MKFYHWIIIAIGVYLFWPKQKLGQSQPSPVTKAGLVTITAGATAQYDTDPKNYAAVNDPRYPGWYRSTVDGSWYKPETEEFYSAGSSPVAIGLSAYESGAMVRPMIDPNYRAPGTGVVGPYVAPEVQDYVIY